MVPEFCYEIATARRHSRDFIEPVPVGPEKTAAVYASVWRTILPSTM
jgi:hypothetical protein